jgi:hypothetical protein
MDKLNDAMSPEAIREGKKEKRTERDELDDRIVSVFHPHALILAKELADNDAEFIKVENYLDTVTFDSSDVPHYVEWGPLDDLEAEANGEPMTPLKPEIFNCDDFRKKTRTVLSRGRVLDRRGFPVGCWCLDEPRMANWLKAYLMADPSEKANLPAPFGIIEPSAGLFFNCRLKASDLAGAGSYVPVTRIEVEWAPPLTTHERNQGRTATDTRSVPPGVKTFVYSSTQTHYRYPAATVSAGYIMKVHKEHFGAPVMDQIRERFGASAGSRSLSGVPFVLPRSGLFDLIEQRADLGEALHNRKQAEGLGIQGHILLSVQTMKPTKEARENLTADDRAQGIELEALMQELQETQRYTYDEWEHRHSEMERAIHPVSVFGSGAGDIIPSSQVTRLQYGRPHPFELMERLPEGYSVAHAQGPQLFADVDKLREDYRRDVAETLGLGLAVLQQFTNGGRGGKGAAASANGGANFSSIFMPSQESDTERHLQHIIQTERNWMVGFFNFLYAKMMNSLDIELLEQIHSSLHNRRVDMREAKLAARVIEHAIAGEMQLTGASHLETDTQIMAKYDDSKARAGDKEDRKGVRKRIQYYRTLIDRLRVRSDAAARLVFQPGTTDRSARQLQVLLEAFFDRGLIEPAQLEPFVQPVFGAGLKLNKEPVAPAHQDEVELTNIKVAGQKEVAAQKVKAAGPPKKKAASSKKRARSGDKGRKDSGKKARK